MVTANYKRVSTTKQEERGASLETQQEILNAYCTIKGFKDTKDYVDVGTGRNTNRDDFQRLMKDIENGKIKNVVVWRLDRLTRSVSDLNKLIKKFKKYGCELHSATESLDTSTANGRMMVNIIGIFAQWESETISERVTINMQSLSDKGIWMSSVPYGFDLVEGRLVINEEEASLFKTACDLILQQGYSFLGAYKHMRDHHGVDWSPDFLTKKVGHETTVGNIMRNGKITFNTHEPLINEELRDKLLEIKAANLTGRSRVAHNDIFRRRIKCFQCNSTLSLNTRKRKDNTYYYSYQCTECFRMDRGSVIVAESVIEKSLVKYMNRLTLTDFHSNNLEPNDDEKQYKELKSKLANINGKRDKIQRAWINDMMSDADLDKYKREIDLEEQKIQEEISKLSVANKSLSTDELKGIKMMFSEGYEMLTRNEKASFIQSHLKEIRFKRTKLQGRRDDRYDVTLVNVVFL